MRVCSFLCSDSLVYTFLFLSTLHGVYTPDCSCEVVKTSRFYIINCTVMGLGAGCRARKISTE